MKIVGGTPARTWLIGEAARYSSGRSAARAPKNCRALSVVCVRLAASRSWVAAMTMQACTALDGSRQGPAPSNSARPEVMAVSPARWPPAEPPMQPMRCGSIFSSAAWARRQRSAALQSCRAAGNFASVASR